MDNNNQQGQINVELDEAIAQGIYSNLAIINHSHAEFVVDFITNLVIAQKSRFSRKLFIFN